jgi:hypothetical protein
MVERLREAKSYKQFINGCRDIIQDSRWNWSIDTKNLAFKNIYSSITYQTWGIQNLDIERVILSSALNGGYFHYDESGYIVKWSLKGSGSLRMGKWLEGWLKLVSKSPQNLPPIVGCNRIEERTAIIKEFYETDWEKVLYWIRMLEKDEILPFELSTVLCETYPISFGSDPFRKKAFLAIKHLINHWVCDNPNQSRLLPVPADYQIPRILMHLRVIDFPYGLTWFEQNERKQKMLDQDNVEVMLLRALTIVAMHELAKEYLTDNITLDNVLFDYRLIDDYKACTLPRIIVDTMWF